MRRLLLASFILTAAACGEDLRYTINWPSGLSLGEGQLTQRKTEAGALESTLKLEAAVPGFPFAEQYRSLASASFCSAEFERDLTRGKHKSREKTTFDAAKGSARRATAGGGSSELATGACARDALAYLYFLRREVAQGRVPSAQKVYAGAAYEVRVEFKGTYPVRIGEGREDADLLLMTVKGPKSDFSFELWLARDAARAPLVIRAPLPIGALSMELVR
ncbi:MAG: DUF3108 domain-containing protein [Acidobacteria bacterium]|nr:DUF3108 domain-containing protein [Acidobacteriota bacterium]